MLNFANKYDDAQKDRQKSILSARSHIAYHYATKQSEGDMEEALLIVEDLEKYKKPYDSKEINHWANVRDTIAWVKINSVDETKKKEGWDIIQRLLTNDEISPKSREEFRGNYDTLQEDEKPDWFKEKYSQ